jgi:DNA-binding response OmpR family regulator
VGGDAVHALILDSDIDSAYSTSAALRARGFEAAAVALTCEDALRQAAAAPPDVVLAPDHGAARRLRECLRGRRVLVAVTSRFTSAEGRRLARSAGADLCLTKPVDPDVLLGLLWLARARAEG